MAVSKEFEVAIEVDACGLRCPLPLLKARQALNQLNSGQSVKVVATDAGSVRDFDAFAKLSGNLLVYSQQHAGRYIYILQKV